MTRPPAEVGMTTDQIDTPALVVDLDAYERNLERMATYLARTPVRLRGHAKTHKCPVIALHQVARGAVGACCQKVSEAEAMVYGGVRNDPTINLYDWYVCVRRGRVEALWPITARGAVL